MAYMEEPTQACLIQVFYVTLFLGGPKNIWNIYSFSSSSELYSFPLTSQTPATPFSLVQNNIYTPSLEFPCLYGLPIRMN